MILFCESQIMNLHQKVAERLKKIPDIRDMEALKKVIGHSCKMQEGSEKHPSLICKVASIFKSILDERPFKEANAATALAAVGVFLRRNNRCLQTTHDEIVSFMENTLKGDFGYREIALWMEEHICKAD